MNLPCSWRRGMRAMLLRLARDAGLTPNALVEALLARELRSPEPTLTLLPRRGSVKPRL
ncbi:hypothetical protein [Opitutus terrae]|uniref:hypothetical protein n=1 Tax=Opitutus terrae TaxID=107709 RepID=UPI0003208D33|nr:hypothetical protein [Opitutus terrae]